ncbi:radical SAM protein [Sulfurospirillum halorespirans]|uniref:PflA domain-containing protein n=1 Tax=Sulfurospirillum halorespirans DSM 13726 TaxID=1193502 RepID=A0A1D7TN56_9BACT|nr:radical SAM protein [Sulfurospirillum halorespirans]AOO66431.1 PflA domain-containing protein [Sulfurospirillum halorespirans DSM 13726]
MICPICERRCRVEDNGIGACGRYQCQNETMIERFANSYLVVAPISAETMPVLHFHPRAKFLQISTTGCNFDCLGCISTVVAKEMNVQSPALKQLSPMQIINKALEQKCDGIAFLMNDPLASFYTFLEICTLAKEYGLLTGCSTNGYFTPESLDLLAPHLDFVNIGLKGLCNDVYKSCGANSYKPVLRNIELFYRKGVHVEVAYIHKKDNEEEVLAIAETLSHISKEIPLQIMRFIPIDDASISLEPSILASEMLYKKLISHLDYVYLFNSPGSECLNTYCPECGALIFERDFYGPMGSKLRTISLNYQNNTCAHCHHLLPIIGEPCQKVFDEDGFEGGYPLTRALEIVEGTLVTLGVTEQKDVTTCWEELLRGDGLKRLHVNIQNFDDYAKTIEYLATLTHREDTAKKLLTYMREKIAVIAQELPNIQTKPRVYYVMGKPLFALEEERLENQLVEMAGGISVNKTLSLKGRPGRKISAQKLNELNPDVIFISSFLDCPLDEFYAYCEKQGIVVNATKHKRIYTHLAPCFDFGSPRWILGLMHIANMLHPERYHFDVLKEATLFYREFYESDFTIASVNRSFAKPSKYHTMMQI